ncbi:MAG: nucleotide exchange factor GrpE [Kofleriaceae bacterium]
MPQGFDLFDRGRWPRSGEPGAIDAAPPEPDDLGAEARAARELDAARARVERDAAKVHAETRRGLVAELLPVLDNLDRTVRAAEASGEAPALLEGVTLVRAQLERVLGGYGVTRIDPVGARFDPAVHEAISVTSVRDPAQHGVVLEAEAGYRMGEQLLRPARVVVGRWLGPGAAR